MSHLLDSILNPFGLPFGSLLAPKMAETCLGIPLGAAKSRSGLLLGAPRAPQEASKSVPRGFQETSRLPRGFQELSKRLQDRFWSHFGAILEPFGEPFWSYFGDIWDKFVGMALRGPPGVFQMLPRAFQEPNRTAQRALGPEGPQSELRDTRMQHESRDVTMKHDASRDLTVQHDSSRCLKTSVLSGPIATQV